MSLPTPQNALNKIWTEFEQVRVLGNARIVQGVAALLARAVPSVTSLEPLYPDVPSELSASQQTEIIEQLKGTDISLAKLFNNYLLFRLRDMQPGSRYPTPRHLVSLMYRLAETLPTMSLADLACGSAGFLAHHLQNGSIGKCIGIEVDFEWAGLAAVNLVLHQSLRPSDSAIPLLFKQDALETKLTFPLVQRVLMNPPFEDPFQTKLLHRALDFLDNNGKLCALIPAGTLFGTNAETILLRQRLVGSSSTSVADFHLQAIIELPKNAARPYSPIKTHVLLAERCTPNEAITWFLRAEDDGYTGVKGRDLTRQQSTPNDLDLVECLVTRWGKPDLRTMVVGEFDIALLDVVAHGTRGLVITTHNPLQLFIAARRHIEKNQTYFELHIQTSSDSMASPDIIWLMLSNITLSIIDPPKLSEQAVQRVWLTPSDPPARSLVIDREGRLIGVGINTQQLHTSPYNLQVDRFVRDREEAITGDPGRITSNLYNREQSLLNTLDELRDVLTDRRSPPTSLPPPLSSDHSTSQQPFGSLSEEQKAVWSCIMSFVRAGDPTKQIYFNSQDVMVLLPQIAIPTVETSLRLFEQMGLIVPVYIRTQSGQQHLAYRRVTLHDYWDLANEQEEAEIITEVDDKS